MPNIAIVDGKLTREEEAVVPVLDRGFLFGDSVYEVVRTRNGVPFQLAEHFARLETSAGRIGLELPLDLGGLAALIRKGLSAAGFRESYLRAVVTRGSGPPNINPAYARTAPCVVLLVRDLGLPPAEAYERGIAAAIPATFRNDRRALDPAIKSGNYLNNILALREALEEGAQEALLLNAEGHVTEATTANVFIVEGGALLTPPPMEGLLLGITRALLLAMAREQGLPAREEPIPLERLQAAAEIFITSTTRDIVPITRLDLRPVGSGAPGPETRRLMGLFAAYVEKVHRAEALSWSAGGPH